MKIKWAFTVASFVMFVMLATGVDMAFASSTNGTISSANYAWGENFGWINFGCANCDIHVTDSAVTGNAWSDQYGWINLAPSNGGVTNDGAGNLGGDAWSSGLGWISFSGATIDSSGVFTGTAGTVGSTAGRINFSCLHCGVTTDWRPASTRGQSGDTSSAGNTVTSSSGSSVWNLFRNILGINTGTVVANQEDISNQPDVSGANVENSKDIGDGIGTLSAYPIATSSYIKNIHASTTAGTNTSDQPLAVTGFGRIGTAPAVLISAVSVLIIVILILRFFL
jgi:hypothetical protein